MWMKSYWNSEHFIIWVAKNTSCLVLKEAWSSKFQRLKRTHAQNARAHSSLLEKTVTWKCECIPEEQDIINQLSTFSKKLLRLVVSWRLGSFKAHRIQCAIAGFALIQGDVNNWSQEREGRLNRIPHALLHRESGSGLPLRHQTSSVIGYADFGVSPKTLCFPVHKLCVHNNQRKKETFHCQLGTQPGEFTQNTSEDEERVLIVSA